MATMIPPRSAKRQRLLDAAKQREAEQLQLDGKLGPATETVVVQLTDGTSGQPAGPLLNLPASTGPMQLQMIVNQLRRQQRDAQRKGKSKRNEEGDDADDGDEDDVPFAFHVSIDAMADKGDDVTPSTTTTNANERLSIARSLADDVLGVAAQRKLGWGAEQVIRIVYEPQAVFRVRPVRRCSSALSGHSSPILCSSFSPTATLLATGSGDRTARIWDLESETPLHALSGHRGWVLCVEWEGRERRLATADKEGDVWIWAAIDARAGRTGRRAWGARSGKQVREELQQQQQQQTDKSSTDDASGATAAATTNDKAKPPPPLSALERRALRHAAPQGKVLRGHSKWVTCLAWQPIHLEASRPRLASSSKDGTVRVWDVERRQCDYVLGGHTHSVNVVRWGGGGSACGGATSSSSSSSAAYPQGVLYTASSDSTVRIWDAADGRPLRVLREHSHWVNTLALSTDWVLRSGPFDHLGRIAGADAKKLADANDAVASDEVEAEAAEARRAKQAALRRYLDTLAASSNEERLVTGSDDHTLLLWPGAPNVPAGMFEGAGGGGATGSAKDGAGKPRRLTGHQQTVNHVSFSPDGRTLASASFDKKLKLWDAATSRFVANLVGHVGAVYRLTWSPDGRIVASASRDGTLKLWDLKRFKILADLPGHTDEVYTCDWAGDKLASAGRDAKLRIWRN